jgi:hypothetical protein
VLEEAIGTRQGAYRFGNPVKPVFGRTGMKKHIEPAQVYKIPYIWETAK